MDRRAVEAMAGCLRGLAASQAIRPETWDDPKYWNPEGSRADRCQLLAVGNAINFRFWTVECGEVVPVGGLVEGEHFRGAMYMWRRLRLATQRGEIDLSAEGLLGVDIESFRRAFQDDDGVLPLAVGVADRVANLRDLGTKMRDRWNGSFAELVDRCEGSLDLFAKFSHEFRAYDDPVQKLTMLNAIMLQGSGLVKFDSDPLPAIDYHLVKQAVRQGIVDPGNTIGAKLRDGQFLSHHESDRLRLAVRDALIAVASQAGLATPVLDNLYWLNRRICADQYPDCDSCRFRDGCAQLVEFGLPLEETRYY
jgi:hypothetical protein